MYKDNCFFFVEIFLICNNLFYQFKPDTPLISFKENEPLVSTTDNKKSFNGISPLPTFGFSYPTIQNISSNSKNWITQNSVKDKVVVKRPKNRGVNF